MVKWIEFRLDGDNYTQHNPQIADGLSGLGKVLKYLASQGITMKYDKIHKVLGEGNFVLTMSEGKLCQNKALACKCFAGKFLIAENRVFKIKLYNRTDNEK